jgi:hypothetical protein
VTLAAATLQGSAGYLSSKAGVRITWRTARGDLPGNRPTGMRRPLEPVPSGFLLSRAALVAFVAEHQRCGDLDGGKDDGYVWIACSCGARIAHPVSVPPPAPART